MATSKDNTATEDLLGDGGTAGAGSVRAPQSRKKNNGPGESVPQVAISEAGENGGVEVDSGDIKDAVSWNPDHSLRRRMLMAQAEVKRLEQDLDVRFGQTQYKGISAAQVVHHAKQILTKHGIFYSSNSEMEWMKRENNKTLVYVEAVFANVDDRADVMGKGSWGEGNDNSDKGVQKATTNAEKIILSKALLMTIDGEDEAQPVETKEPGESTEVRKLDDEANVNIQQWAGAYKSALEGCKTIEMLNKVRKDNKSIMKSDRVPDVTREFFVDLIATLEGQLPSEGDNDQSDSE